MCIPGNIPTRTAQISLDLHQRNRSVQTWELSSAYTQEPGPTSLHFVPQPRTKGVEKSPKQDHTTILLSVVTATASVSPFQSERRLWQGVVSPTVCPWGGGYLVIPHLTSSWKVRSWSHYHLKGSTCTQCDVEILSPHTSISWLMHAYQYGLPCLLARQPP